MAIHSFLKAERGDPDWQFTPDQYFGKEFQMIDASIIELKENIKDLMVLRQTPTDKKLLAKHLKIQVKENAELDLVIINEADSKLQQIFLYDVHLHKNSTINFGIFAKDGKLNKHIIQVSFEDNSAFNGYGLLSNTVGGDTEIITKIIHQNYNTTSNQLFLGMAGENSQTVYQGMVVLEEGSDGSDANITSTNMITGTNGRCFSKPEIYLNCDNTSSSCGSITDRLDREKIYYLQSRGFSEKDARTLITSSFKNLVLNLIQHEDLKQEITQMYA